MASEPNTQPAKKKNTTPSTAASASKSAGASSKAVKAAQAGAAVEAKRSDSKRSSSVEAKSDKTAKIDKVPSKTAGKSGSKSSSKPEAKPSTKPADDAATHTDWSHVVVQFMRNLFVRQVKLERKGRDLRFVLSEPENAPASTQPAPLTAASDRSKPVPVPSSVSEDQPSHAALLGIDSRQLKRMQQQLSEVLDQHPQTRSVFPHLNYFDKMLRRQGADCFRDLPVEVLHKALIQLDTVMQTNCPDQAGLAELRACLVVSAVDRGTPETEDDVNSILASSLSDFNLSSKLSVNEVSHSDFLAAHQQWDAADETIKLQKA